jgi:tetratricopeptide (TPR) repeat protein
MKLNVILIFILCFLFSCTKQDAFLDIKSNLSDVTPTTLADFQALLDLDATMNDQYPAAGIVSGDNYYLSNANYSALTVNFDRNLYIWAPDIVQSATASWTDWTIPYRIISRANIVLDGIQSIEQTDQNKEVYRNIKGSALFYRALMFHILSDLFAKPYFSTTANSDLGIPLRTTSDVNIIVQRSTLKETYEKIIFDITEALPLLPTIPPFKTRPSKTAAEALLARIYMSMDDYANAQVHSDNALKGQNTLIDLNTLNSSATFPFPTIKNGNVEVIFYATHALYSAITNSKLFVDSNLFKLYATNDLRKSIFFNPQSDGSILFKGYLTGTNNSYFAGMGTNEMYFIRAEANARLGNVASAMKDLNDLLRMRWKKNGSVSTYADQTAIDAADAISKIILERRKDMPFTWRWQEIRRLNKEMKYAITITRIINGITYTLPPNDNKYVMPIPESETRLSGIIQNPR